ncbi:MAG: tRNA uridine-5-carboxymethylaminomethyl(34) synthesis GTPase MnmE [Candidatus Eisenbacteria bacterium]
MTTDTIAAQSTARGTAAIAVLRLSGPDAITILERHFHPPGRISRLPSHQCAVGAFHDGGEAIDQVVVTLFRAPNSYTGEDLIEIGAHGGDWTPGRILKSLWTSGARPARPGEFTERAFLNGKIDLAQAEAVEALVRARSGAAARAALRILSGGLKGALVESMERLTGALAGIEAGLDIQQDGAPDAIAPQQVDGREILRAERERLQSLLQGGHAGKLMEEGARVVLTGRPNAGKSSILNAFLARARALVSPIPGTTRDAIEAWVEWEGVPVVLVDTAGLSPSERPDDHGGDPLANESRGRTLEALASATLVVQVVDAHATCPEDLVRDIERMSVPSDRILVALHKWDLGPCSAWNNALQAEAGMVRSSVVEAPGVEPLRRAIARRLKAAGDEAEAALLVGERQRMEIGTAQQALLRALEHLDRGGCEELAAFELRSALDHLGEILGLRVGPLLLERIFSTFCVGK